QVGWRVAPGVCRSAAGSGTPLVPSARGGRPFSGRPSSAAPGAIVRARRFPGQLVRSLGGRSPVALAWWGNDLVMWCGLPDAVGPHHLVVFVLDDVAVPDEQAGAVEGCLHAGDLAGVGDDGVLAACLPGLRTSRWAVARLGGS